MIDRYVLRDEIIYIDDFKTKSTTKSYIEAKDTFLDALKEIKTKQNISNETKTILNDMEQNTIRPIKKEYIVNFSHNIFRVCEWCGEEFNKTTSDRVVCTGKCRTAMSRARANIKKATFTKSDKEIHAVFQNGYVCKGTRYDFVSYKGCSCKMINSFHSDNKSIEDKGKWIFYYQKEADLITISDVEGKIPLPQLIFIYKEVMKGISKQT